MTKAELVLARANRERAEAYERKISAAFRKLKIWRPSDGRLTYESLIPGLWRELLMISSAGRAFSPHSEAASRATTERELATLRKRAASLLKAVEALHEQAICALNYRKPWPGGPGGIETQLRILVAAASHAKPSEPLEVIKKGRKAKGRPQALANAVALHFFHLTGEMPTRITDGGVSGPFIYLLKEVYEALGVVASADHYAKKAIKAVEEYRAKKLQLAP